MKKSIKLERLQTLPKFYVSITHKETGRTKLVSYTKAARLTGDQFKVSLGMAILKVDPKLIRIEPVWSYTDNSGGN